MTRYSFFEPKALYQTSCDVPDEMYTIPSARRPLCARDDCTVVAFGQMVNRAAAAMTRWRRKALPAT